MRRVRLLALVALASGCAHPTVSDAPAIVLDLYSERFSFLGYELRLFVGREL